MELSKKEEEVRGILIEVARGMRTTHKLGLISYKELWTLISDEAWGRGKKNEIVKWITRISAHELEKGCPPLNELVVVKTTNEPGDEWSNIKAGLKQLSSMDAPYETHREAQEDCSRYWGRQAEPTDTDKEEQAEEGYRQDRTVVFRKRNAALIERRKRKDNYTCQACSFVLAVNGTFIIDCHHVNPLGLAAEVTVTHLDDLVCLCPTCHRIAHTKRYPLDVKEIQEERRKLANNTIQPTR